MTRRTALCPERKRVYDQLKALNQFRLPRRPSLSRGLSLGLKDRRWADSMYSTPRVIIYPQDHEPLSSLSLSRFKFGGRCWRTVEHAYHCIKAKHFDQHYLARKLQFLQTGAEVRSAVHRSMLWMLSRSDTRKAQVWDDLKTRLAYTLTLEKFSQNGWAADYLCRTLHRNYLADGSNRSRFWSIGLTVHDLSDPEIAEEFMDSHGSGPGENRHGQILMAVRERLDFMERSLSGREGSISPADTFLNHMEWKYGPMRAPPAPMFSNGESEDENNRVCIDPDLQAELDEVEVLMEFFRLQIRQELDWICMQKRLAELGKPPKPPAVFGSITPTPHAERRALEPIPVPAPLGNYSRAAIWNGPAGARAAASISAENGTTDKFFPPTPSIFPYKGLWEKVGLSGAPSTGGGSDFICQWGSEEPPLPDYLYRLPFGIASAQGDPSPGPSRPSRRFGQGLHNEADQPGCSRDWPT